MCFAVLVTASGTSESLLAAATENEVIANKANIR
jgi:hypothetical protein